MIDYSLFPITFQQIVIFLTVVQEGGFARAGSKLNITQSAISKNISRLENALELDLFSRTTREVTLTPAGKKLAESWSPLVQEFSRVHKQAMSMQEENEIQLNVGLVHTSHPRKYIGETINRFRIHNPDINLLIKFHNIQDLETNMLNGMYDLIVMPDFERFWAIDNNLSFRWIARSNAYVILSEKHPLAKYRELYMKDLIDYIFAVPSYLSNNSYIRDLNERFDPLGKLPKTVSTFESAHDMQFLFSSVNPELLFVDAYIDPPENEGILKIPVVDQENGMICIWNPSHMRKPLHRLLKSIP